MGRSTLDESIKKALLAVNPFSGTPFEITEEEAALFRGRDMELYRWHWQRLVEKGFLPKDWMEQTEKEMGEKLAGYSIEVKERTCGLLACRRALEEWKKKQME